MFLLTSRVKFFLSYVMKNCHDMHVICHDINTTLFMDTISVINTIIIITNILQQYVTTITTICSLFLFLLLYYIIINKKCENYLCHDIKQPIIIIISYHYHQEYIIYKRRRVSNCHYTLYKTYCVK